jgi:RNA ligase
MSHPLALQVLLRTDGLPALEPLGIRARRHAQFPQLVCFKYSQRTSPMNEPAVQDARGLILDEADDWAVVSMSFRKFFNLGEPHAAELDWRTARVEEKLDGSLLCLYPYAGAWQVQTSGTADASGPVVQDIRRGHASLTYRDLFWQTWAQLGYVLPDADLRYTLAFELMTPENRVVVPHAFPRLVLHGVRDLGTLQEEPAEAWAARLGYEAAGTVALDPAGLRAAAGQIPATVGEGFVVRDAAFRRVKVKSDAYVQVSLIREGWSGRRALELMVLGELDEFLNQFPEYRGEVEALLGQVRAVTDRIDAVYAELRDLPDQKAFAAAAGPYRFAPALFSLRQGRARDGADWLAGLEEAQRLRALAQAGVTLRAE